MAAPAQAISSSASSSYSTIPFNYDVFLSFRGEDTRNNFTDHLYTSLVQAGVNTFKDNEELHKGEEINPNLLKAIEKSRISVIIFSRNYASSTWCLGELVKILECRKKPIAQTVLPIFLDGAEPSAVRKQVGSFGEALCTHEANFGSEVVDRWRIALREAAGLGGWDQKSVGNGRESKLISEVVRRVLSILNPIPSNVAKYPVGIHSRVEEMMALLNNSSVESKHVKIVGICGMGGIGKTTIAKAVYYQIFHNFECSCFLEGVREASKEYKGLINLQRQLLSEILKKKFQFYNVNEGKALIRKRLGAKKVLVILDDVDDIVQVEALASGIDSFGLESRVIITTRDEHVLNLNHVNEIYRPEELEFHQSLQLFSYHAFSRGQPLDGFLKLSKNVVHKIGGLPLALEVLGCFLSDKETPEEWKSTLEKLEKIPPKEIQEKLKINYDALDDLNKEIFLHIACFFIGTDMEYANYILEGCELCSTIGIKVLIQKSLVKIDNNNKLRMHNLLRDMGREIVRKESPDEPGKRSRLWSHEEALRVLKECTGTRNVKGLLLKFDQGVEETVLEEHHFNAEAFAALSNLILLNLDDAHLVGDFKHLLSELRWLKWKCPLELLPTNFYPKKLTILDLSHSLINRFSGLWHQNKFANLKVLDLSWCRFLARTPHFSGLPNLQTLILKCCKELVEVHESIGNLKRLVLLDLSWCENVVELPSSIWKLGSLQNLWLSHCSKLTKLPEQLGSVVSSIDLASGINIEKIPNSIELIRKIPSWIGLAGNLTDLSLCGTSITELPSAIGLLGNLVKLDVSWCDLVKLPDSMEKMKSLKFLDMRGTGVVKLPEDFGKLSSLEKLNMAKCQELESVQENFGHLVNLWNLDMEGSGIVKLSEDFGQLSSLEVLNIKFCHNLKSLPENFGNLVKLRDLDMEESGIVKLSEDFGQLSSLMDLNIKFCQNLKSLPENFGNLVGLRVLAMEGSSMVKLPDDFGQLSRLETLNIKFCQNLKSLPENFGNLVGLRVLLMEGSSMVKLPDDFGQLSRLETLNIKFFQNLKSLPENFGNLIGLRVLVIEENNMVKLPDDFGQLSRLETLNIKFCQNLKSLPENFGNFVGLRNLVMKGSSMVKLPDDFGQLSKLEILNIKFCQNLKSLPENFGNLVELSNLDMEGSGIVKLPNDFGKLSNLKELNMDDCQELKIVPENFWNLVHLNTLCMHNKRIVKLPEVVESLLENFDNIAQLRVLYASNVFEGVIPSDIEKLCSLELWRLSGNKFYSLPASICELSMLKSLYLRNCTNLQVLPKLPSSLNKVDATNCMSLERIIDFSNLNNLCSLYLDNCTKLQALPDLPSSLENLGVTNCQRFPDVSKLKKLRSLSFSNSSKLQSLPECVGSVQSDAANCMSNSLSPIQVLVQQGKFEHLESLCFPGSNVPDCFIPVQFDRNDWMINLSVEIPASTAEVAQPGELNLDIEIIGVVFCVVFSVKGLQYDLYVGCASVTVFSDIDEIIFQDFSLKGCNIIEEEHDQIYLQFFRKDSASKHHLNGGKEIRATLHLRMCFSAKLDMKKGGFYVVYNSNEDSTTLQKTTYERMAAEFFTSSCGASVGTETSANKKLVDRNAIDFSVSSFSDEAEVDRLCIDGSNANGPDKDELDLRLTPSTIHSSNDVSSNTFFDTDDDWGLLPWNQKKPKKNPPLDLNEEEDVHLSLSLNHHPKADGLKKDELDLRLSLNHPEADNDWGPLPPKPKKPKKNPPLDLNEEEDVHLSLSLNHPKADGSNMDELDLSFSLATLKVP